MRSAQYRSQLLIETVGLVEKLVHYRAKTSASGRLGEGDSLLPVNFARSTVRAERPPVGR